MSKSLTFTDKLFGFSYKGDDQNKIVEEIKASIDSLSGDQLDALELPIQSEPAGSPCPAVTFWGVVSGK